MGALTIIRLVLIIQNSEYGKSTFDVSIYLNHLVNVVFYCPLIYLNLRKETIGLFFAWYVGWKGRQADNSVGDDGLVFHKGEARRLERPFGRELR